MDHVNKENIILNWENHVGVGIGKDQQDEP